MRGSGTNDPTNDLETAQYDDLFQAVVIYEPSDRKN